MAKSLLITTINFSFPKLKQGLETASSVRHVCPLTCNLSLRYRLQVLPESLPDIHAIDQMAANPKHESRDLCAT
jgi:hypothetical protein